jgi:hypothetical protein
MNALLRSLGAVFLLLAIGIAAASNAFAGKQCSSREIVAPDSGGCTQSP